MDRALDDRDESAARLNYASTKKCNAKPESPWVLPDEAEGHGIEDDRGIQIRDERFREGRKDGTPTLHSFPGPQGLTEACVEGKRSINASRR